MKTITFCNVLPEVFRPQADIVSDVWKKDFSIEKEKIYLIQADSGKGKSTFCSYLIGHRNDYSGTICFDNRDIASISTREWSDIRQTSISHMFQELRLFPELTALENVLIKNQITRFKTDKQIANCFERLGLSDRLHYKIGKMSFGQQQRVAFIRALVQPFDFLLADEPISHLDEGNAAVMGEMMMEEIKSRGAALVVMSIGKHITLPYDKTLCL